MEKYCKECKNNIFIIDIYDEKGNKIKFEPIEIDRYDSSKGRCFKFRLKNVLSIFTIMDLRYLKFLLGEKLKYGGDTVTEMRKYAEIYEKIEKELEENNINQ